MEGVHPLTISVTHLHLSFITEVGARAILSFNYFYIEFGRQILKTFTALVYCLKKIPQVWYSNYIQKL